MRIQTSRSLLAEMRGSDQSLFISKFQLQASYPLLWPKNEILLYMPAAKNEPSVSKYKASGPAWCIFRPFAKERVRSHLIFSSDAPAEVDLDRLDIGVAKRGEITQQGIRLSQNSDNRKRSKDTYLFRQCSPCSRPMPDCLYPPNGTFV